MKRLSAGLALLACLAGLWWFVRSPDSPPPAKIDVQSAWTEQINAVANGPSTQIVLPDLNIPARFLSDLKPIAERLTELNLSGDDLAQGINEIAGCPHLKILHLRTELGDAEIGRLAQLHELEVLDLPLALHVTDKGIQALSQHPKLKLIRLRAPQLSDAGLPTFATLPELRWLHLMEVPLTDRGLEVFRSMARLESLYLDGDRATDEGLSNLVLARPDLHFHRDQLHLPEDPRRRDGHQD
ncbi:MAG: hypothetical protein U0929_02150 [Planctomycetaceae bacterium]